MQSRTGATPWTCDRAREAGATIVHAPITSPTLSRAHLRADGILKAVAKQSFRRERGRESSTIQAGCSGHCGGREGGLCVFARTNLDSSCVSAGSRPRPGGFLRTAASSRRWARDTKRLRRITLKTAAALSEESRRWRGENYPVLHPMDHDEFLGARRRSEGPAKTRGYDRWESLGGWL